MAFTISGSLAIDETSGAQGGSSSSNFTADTDVGVTAFVDTNGAPEFDEFLSNFFTAATSVSVSNASSINPFGTALLTGLGDDVTNLAFTDSLGAALDGDVAKFGAGASDFLRTADGAKIFLYSYAADDLSTTYIDETNIVLGRKGTWNGIDYVADTSGALVFAAYLQPTDASGNVLSSDTGAVGAKVWLVEYEPIDHGIDGSTAADYDDARFLFDPLYVTVSNRADFSLQGAPSGQNLFLMFGDGTPSATDATIIVTGKDPINQSDSTAAITDGDTVNTGKGGGDTTLGTNSQQIVEGKGLYFTFVKGADTNFTVPNLDQNEADVEANIAFTSLFGSTGASFSVVQSASGDKSTLEISAYTTPLNPGNAFIDNLHNNTSVEVNKVTVTTQPTKEKGQVVPGETLVFNKYGTGGIGTTPTTLSDITVTFSANTVTIKGLEADDLIEYQTSAQHTRVLIDNIGSADTNFDAPFDIGGFALISSSVTSNQFSALTFQDDGPSATGTPVTATVDEDGLSGGIAGGVGDVAGEVFSVSGSVAGIFQPGADGLGSYGLSTDTSGLLQTLTSQGGAVVYNVSYDSGTNTHTLTAYVEVTGVGYSAAADREVFTLALNGATGAYTFTLLDQLDHATLNGLPGDDTENNLTLNLGSILQVFDKDGDFATAAAEKLAITVDDDTPVVTAKSNLVYANTSNGPGDPGGTGIFSYAIGADERTGTTYSLSNSDFGTITLSGTVGANAITGTSVVWASETASQAVFDVNYSYVSNNPTQGAQTVIDTETATLTFNKLAGTYTLSIPEIESFSILKTSTPGNPLQGYALDSATTVASNPPVSVMTLASDFFVQFEGFAEKNDPISFSYDVNTGLFSNTHEYVTVSTNTIGVSGDTVQQNEVIDLDFFTENPKGFVSIADPSNPVNPPATSKAVYVKMDGIGSEDLLVVLKLVDANGFELNRTFIVDNEDIHQKPNPQTQPAAATAYGVTLDNNDGVVIFESNDYNFDTETYSIQGMQIVTETQSLAGSGYELNGAIDDPLTQASEGATLETLHAFDASTDDSGNEPIKITDLGFVASTTPDAHMEFTVQVQDSDGDTTGTQTLAVDIIGGNSVTASAGADTFVISDADSSDLLHMVMHVIDGGFATTVDKLDMAAGGSFTDGGSATDVKDFIADADLALNGSTDFYFADFGGDGYLAFDADGSGITSIVRLVGATDMVAGDII